MIVNKLIRLTCSFNELLGKLTINAPGDSELSWHITSEGMLDKAFFVNDELIMHLEYREADRKYVRYAVYAITVDTLTLVSWCFWQPVPADKHYDSDIARHLLRSAVLQSSSTGVTA